MKQNAAPQDRHAIKLMLDATQIDLEAQLRIFDPERTLIADAREIGRVIEGREPELAQAFWDRYSLVMPAHARLDKATIAKMNARNVEYTRKKTDSIGERVWLEAVSQLVLLANGDSQLISVVRASLAASYLRGAELCAELLKDDPAKRLRLEQATYKIMAIENEVISLYMRQLAINELKMERNHRMGLFKNHFATELESASAVGDQLREQAGSTSSATRGMLGKTSEVAAAAEQSATAMRDAAHTAAGLIRAIEEARGEVEVAADVATRAAAQASEAVQVSQALTDTAKSIESILGLIRDVAGQTNLLALNATIEAARAGDAGRGFAVVAQEVKSLANQTARATDDIATKIAAIQAATQSTVVTSGAIRDTVAEVQASAMRIRGAMDAQAQTVTMITAAVDETALAADTMSSTIAAIRQETETVATEIDTLEDGFSSVNTTLARLKDSAQDYLKMVA